MVVALENQGTLRKWIQIEVQHNDQGSVHRSYKAWCYSRKDTSFGKGKKEETSCHC